MGHPRCHLDGLAAQPGAVGIGWRVTWPQVQEDFARVANAIARFEPVKMVVDPSALASAKALCGPNIELIELAVNDSWCRDSARASSATRSMGWPV
jgi:agmatine/peptidylarginine deiminase